MHLRQILLAENKGIKSFFKVKVLSDFDFGHFLRNWLQRHLVGKVLQVQNSSGHYQYVSLVCNTYSKSQEELFDSFFILKWTVRLDFRYTTGVASPDRHVRTRLYFTSESHIHSLLTMLTEGGLIDVSDFFCIFLSKVQIARKEVKKLGLLESVVRHWNSIIGKSSMKGYQVLNMRLCVKP